MNFVCFKMIFNEVGEVEHPPSLEALEEHPLGVWVAEGANPCQGEHPFQVVLPFQVDLPSLQVDLPCSLEDLPFHQAGLPYSLVGQVASYHQGDPNPWVHPLGDPSPFQVDPRIQVVVACLGIWEALEDQACLKAVAALALEALVLPLNLEAAQGALDVSQEEQEGEGAYLQEEERGVGA